MKWRDQFLRRASITEVIIETEEISIIRLRPAGAPVRCGRCGEAIDAEPENDREDQGLADDKPIIRPIK